MGRFKKIKKILVGIPIVHQNTVLLYFWTYRKTALLHPLESKSNHVTYRKTALLHPLESKGDHVTCFGQSNVRRTEASYFC